MAHDGPWPHHHLEPVSFSTRRGMRSERGDLRVASHLGLARDLAMMVLQRALRTVYPQVAHEEWARRAVGSECCPRLDSWFWVQPRCTNYKLKTSENLRSDRIGVTRASLDKRYSYVPW